MKFSKYMNEKCGMCKHQGNLKICLRHVVNAPNNQRACNDWKGR